MRALALADEVYLGAVARSDRLKAEERFDAEAVLKGLESQGVRSHTAPTNAGLRQILIRNVRADTKRPRLVLFFSNGSFDGIIADCVTALRS
jgi:UDP-N-acetylmuramate: L-alanyl-gamma-D-glutamyl-meso-diaminopimelate ligase